MFVIWELTSLVLPARILLHVRTQTVFHAEYLDLSLWR